MQSAELDCQRYELLASTNAIAREQLDQQVDVAHKAAVPPLLHPDGEAGNVRQVGSGDGRPA